MDQYPNQNQSVNIQIHQTNQPKSWKAKAIEVAKFLGLFLLIFTITYTLINYQTFWERTKYFYQTNIKKEDLARTFLPQIADKDPEDIAQAPVQTVSLQDNHLYIPKLAISAPIIWDIPESQILDKLHDGVIHYKETAHPGEGGNTFITGHSSYYAWDWGKYKSVFALLGKLNPGDEIIVTYQGRVYAYQVIEKFEVAPNQVEVLKKTNYPTLTLMTCTPVGTALRRLIIRASEVNPA